MAARHIPNLSTLRASQPNRPPRRRAPEAQASKDAIIRGTDNDASVSRLSAVETGYLDDPFAKAFVTSETDRWIRRFPIINRGTYVRTKAIDELVGRFLGGGDERNEGKQVKQVVSLGAGSDTRWFRLCNGDDQRGLVARVVYHEFDFPENTTAKINAITKVVRLNECVGPMEISMDGTKLASANYYIHPVDLRTLSAMAFPSTIDRSLPTLIISECCLCYLEPSAADAALDFFVQLFPCDVPLGLIVYEPINPFDSFGEVMVSNLAARGIVLQTLQKYHSLNAQVARLRRHGFSSGNRAADVGWLWEKWVSAAEKERIAGLEMLDEVEEWNLLARHYCVVWAGRGGKGASLWSSWEELQNEETRAS